MIIVRHYTEDDLERVKALHRNQGLEYQLPDLEADTMLVRTVVEEDACITHAAFLRKTAEAYWIFNPKKESRKDKLGKLLMLHKELTVQAKRAGFEDVHCWIPQNILTKPFQDTLFHLGWVKPEWVCFSREVK